MSRPALSGGSCSWGAWQPLPARLRVVPLALFVLIVPSYLLRGYFETVFGNPVMTAIVAGLGQSLPFFAIALLGWVVLKDYDAEEPLAVSGGSAESAGAARGMARVANWPAGMAWGRVPVSQPLRLTGRKSCFRRSGATGK
jgi:hypothetical protein